MVPERITQLLTAYVDGELSGRQRKAVSRMLRKSPEARKLYHKIKGDSLILRHLPRKKPKFSLTDTVMGSIKATGIEIPIRPEAMGLPPGPPPLPSKTIPAWVVFAVAAAVLLVVGIGSYYFFARSAEVGPGPIARSQPAPGHHPGWDDRIPADEPHDVFTYPNLKAPAFGTAQPRVPLVLSFRDARQSSFLEEVQEELQKDRAFRCDLFSRDGGQAWEKLKSQLEGQGIRLEIDGSVQSRQPLNVALYTEGLTPTELARLLQQLGEAENEGDSSFIRLALTRSVPWRPCPTGVDIYQPLEDMTLDQVLQAPPRPERVEEVVGERVAVVVPYEASQAAPAPAVRAVLDRYPSRRAGTLQVLLVLWNNPTN